MRCNEITLLNEAPVVPGELRSIQTKIEDYEEKVQELKDLRAQIQGSLMGHPSEIRPQIDAYIEAYRKEIRRLEDELKKTFKVSKFDNLIKGIVKNCGDAIDEYRKNYNCLYIELPKDKSVVYGKPGSFTLSDQNSNDRFKNFVNIMQNELGALDFTDRVIVSSDTYNFRSPGLASFMFFPVNGFDYFFSRRRKVLELANHDIPNFANRELIKELWHVVLGNDDVAEEFRKLGGKVSYSDLEYAGEWSGFLGELNWNNNIDVIGQLIDKGIIDSKWEPYKRWQAYIDSKSAHAFFDMQINTRLGAAIDWGNQIAIKCSGYYAINEKYKERVLTALKIN